MREKEKLTLSFQKLGSRDFYFHVRKIEESGKHYWKHLVFLLGATEEEVKDLQAIVRVFNGLNHTVNMGCPVP